MQSYPLKFEPILKPKIWGGNKLSTWLHRPCSSSIPYGESWELFSFAGQSSCVLEGFLKGVPLSNLIQNHSKWLLGERRKQALQKHDKTLLSFPLLIKVIDAKEDLSIQVHPDDRTAWRRHRSYGKTEFWYILQADKNAHIYYGFKERLNEKRLKSHIKAHTLHQVLNKVKVHEGDMFLLPAGTVHAIGGGVLLVEVQQASDLTYRLYDWNRRDAKGHLRELHIEPALTCISYEPMPHAKLKGTQVSSPYFDISFSSIPSEGSVAKPYLEDSCVILIGLSGKHRLRTPANKGSLNSPSATSLDKGDVALLPAALKHLEIEHCTPLEDSLIMEVRLPN